MTSSILASGHEQTGDCPPDSFGRRFGLTVTCVGVAQGEAEHCRMVAVPSIEAEDAKIPHRERAARSRECTRVINRMKSTLARLGIRVFRPDLKKAAGRAECHQCSR